MALTIATFAGLLTAVLLCFLLFKDWDDFIESLKFSITPEIISLLKGQWHEDRWAESRLLLCAVISLFVVVCAYLKFS